MKVVAGFTILLIVHLELGVSERPNIVIIIADDLGWNDVGFHSGDIDTPNIDALAYHGIILNRHYGLPVCSPSRASLLTGDYPLRHGMQGGPCVAGRRDGLPLDVKIMPQYFSELGYKSHLVGKWHLGYESADYLPTRRGFDSFFGYYNGYLGYWDYVHLQRKTAGRDIRRNEEGVWGECYGRYLTDVLTEEAVKVISQHPQEDGLLLVFSHAAVHSTPLGQERDSPKGVQNRTHRGYFRATAERMDWSVGQVTRALNDKGLLNNSIIVFLSDNGAPTTYTEFTNYGSNWPLRGEKVSLHDGGVRTVAALWSPLLENKSLVSEQYFHISDWLPTLYAAAGGQPKNLENKDGINQWTSLVSSTPGTRDTILININDLDKTEAVIKNNWKLIKNYDPKLKQVRCDIYYQESRRWVSYDENKLKNSVVFRTLGPAPEDYRQLRQSATIDSRCPDPSAAIAEDCHTRYCLFDIAKDPTECHNLAANNSKIVADLKAIIDSYRPSLVPSPPKFVDRRANPKNWDDYWSPWTE